MEVAKKTTPSPGLDDKKMTQLTTSSDTLDMAGTHKADSLGHQGEKSTGGKNENLRVLHCTHLNLSTNYETLYDIFRTFGDIERMKMKLVNDKYFEGYVIFYNPDSAQLAFERYESSSADKARYGTKILNAKNILDEDSDFIPSLCMNSRNREHISRPVPTPYWLIAYYKEGKENMLSGTKFLERKFGHLPKGNIKKYGKNILVKAENKIQVAMLSHFTPLENDIIAKIAPHRTFNTVKGVVYSHDLYEFTEEEILEMCPSTVYEIKKLSGRNGAILLHFSTRFIPDFIDVEHSRIKVKKYKYKPRQCYKCFEFGHVATLCRNNPRCSSCSGDHEPMEQCGPMKCRNCGECHPPTSKECIRFKFEQDILEVAHNEFISIGNAKRQVLGANQSPGSSYVSVVKNIKNNSRNRNTLNHKPIQSIAANLSQASSSSQLANLPSLETPTIRTSSSAENLGGNKNPPPLSLKYQSTPRIKTEIVVSGNPQNQMQMQLQKQNLLILLKENQKTAKASQQNPSWKTVR